jgi:hypothetical protein
VSVDVAKKISQVACETNREARTARGLVDGLQDPCAGKRDMVADARAADVVLNGGLDRQAMPFYDFAVNGWGRGD